ncbi:hypothetical protein JCM11641_008349 [Rhodosporidiobolus odoratus]
MGSTNRSASVGANSSRGIIGSGVNDSAANKRRGLAERNLAMLSLPSQDSPAFYDSPSSPSAGGSDDELSDSDFLSSSRPLGSSAIPLTNRGNKLLRNAPHVRRNKLGHHANVDAGFSDPLMSQSALVPPAQKRRRLNDLAPPLAKEGFPVAPNLHLVPRSVHTLNREADEPFPAYLPPVAQSPLDLLLSPAVQHTLGKKNPTFVGLGMSTTGLIEQEAELVGALTKVCRGLRGEGFEYRWEGDEDRKKERQEQAKKEEEDRDKEAVEQEEQDQARVAEEEGKVAEAAAGEQRGTAMEVDGQADASGSGLPPSDNVDAVKVEQETPILSAPTVPAPADAALPLARNDAPSTDAPAAPPAVPQRDSTSTNNPPTPLATGPPSSAQNGDVAMGEAAVDAHPLSAAEGTPAALPLVDGLPPVASTSASTDSLPAISVTDASTALTGSSAPSTDSLAVQPAPSTSVPAPHAASNGEPLPPLPSGEPSTSLQESAVDTLVAHAGNGISASADASQHSRSIEATPALTGDGEGSEEPARRRSGRVATRGAGAGGSGTIRHTRSRQSSPEEDYVSGEEDEEFSGEGEEERRGGRGQYVPEEELPEYATRMVDPEVFVRGLFVSEGNVEMERMAQGPHGALMGTGQMEVLTPNEQEVLLHDCLTDLHRFLADTLEYRSRLGEIRDGVLGVERRRKGMWKILRQVAGDFLQEESWVTAEGGYE